MYRLPLLPTSAELVDFHFHLKAHTPDTTINENRTAMQQLFGRELVKRISSRDYSEGEMDMKPLELPVARLFLSTIPLELLQTCYRSTHETFNIPINNKQALHAFTGLENNFVVGK